MDQAATTRELTTSNARLIALISVIIGLAISWIAGAFVGKWFASGLEAVGDAALSIGALSLIYDLFMRRQIQSEMLNLVKLEKDLALGQIKSAKEISEIDWDEHLSGSSEYRCLLIDPSSWIDHNWAKIHRAYSERQVLLQVLMPDPNAAYISDLATKLNVAEADYRAKLRDAASGIEDRWRTARNKGSVHVGSSIEVRYLASAPSYSIVLSGSKVVMAIGRSVQREGREEDFAVAFVGSLRTYPNSWFHLQLTSIRDGNIRFEEKAE